MVCSMVLEYSFLSYYLAPKTNSCVSHDTKEISEYYDKIVDVQLRFSYNRRHYLLLKHLLQNGLNTNSHILEIGCGIGIMTRLMGYYVKRGKIFSIDISKNNIAEARRLNNRPNIEFAQGDAVNFPYPQYDYNFITLFDVLEHIPDTLHADLFAHIARYMHENTLLIINIPNPEALQYYIDIRHPDLQIVDQPLQADKILAHAYTFGMYLTYFKDYGIWYEREYQIMSFKKRTPVNTPTPKPYRLTERLEKYYLQIASTLRGLLPL
ncbi:MAG: methyltransferase domain-containing protein [Chitinophagales bacterium]|nr:methyltransferase domain-containing protein [Chitinophagales bacterium]